MEESLNGTQTHTKGTTKSNSIDTKTIGGNRRGGNRRGGMRWKAFKRGKKIPLGQELRHERTAFQWSTGERLEILCLFVFLLEGGSLLEVNQMIEENGELVVEV